ncbi:MAG: hypothetical protein WAM14_02975 [Candidatus Nitrosopolaris sp.]
MVRNDGKGYLIYCFMIRPLTIGGILGANIWLIVVLPDMVDKTVYEHG